jgi:TrmH family RNA methyltransferase
MVGSESHGLPDDIIQRSDHRTTIAMPGGIESFNASVAASIAMYAMTALDG